MSIENDQAIVLRLTDYSESSQIVSLLTLRSGLVRLIAKGARRGSKKRFAAGLDLMEWGELAFSPPRGEAGLGTLTEWKQRDAFLGLRNSSLGIHGSAYAAELVASTCQELDPHEGLFEGLLELLRELADSAGAARRPSDKRPSIVRFQALLLTRIGYAPTLRQCARCGRPRPARKSWEFSSSAGGVVCEDCVHKSRDHVPMPRGVLSGATIRQQPQEWFALLDYHLACVAGKPFTTGNALRVALLGAS